MKRKMECTTWILAAILGLGVAGTATAQTTQRKVLATVAGVEIREAEKGRADSFSCESVGRRGDMTILMLGYGAGYEAGLVRGATAAAVRAGLSLDFATEVIEDYEAPALRVGAFSAEASAICDEYPAAGVRDVLTAAFDRVRQQMRKDESER